MCVQVAKHVSAENVSDLGVSSTADRMAFLKTGAPPLPPRPPPREYNNNTRCEYMIMHTYTSKLVEIYYMCTCRTYMYV